MDDFSSDNDKTRLRGLATAQDRSISVNRGYSRFIRSMRIILPLIAVGMTVVILTWEQAGRHVEPIKKEELVPESASAQNELLKPVYKSVDAQQRPYTVTADVATQDRNNPDLVNLQQPKAELQLEEGKTVSADAVQGLYQQNAQKLNLEGDVHLKNSEGYTLSTEELRVDIATQKAFSGRDVRVEGPAGTIDAKGLEGDGVAGTLVFIGPAKVVLYNEGNLLP
jgi:lipopolysaccharide export system protein LptC